MGEGHFAWRPFTYIPKCLHNRTIACSVTGLARNKSTNQTPSRTVTFLVFKHVSWTWRRVLILSFICWICKLLEFVLRIGLQVCQLFVGFLRMREAKRVVCTLILSINFKFTGTPGQRSGLTWWKSTDIFVAWSIFFYNTIPCVLHHCGVHVTFLFIPAFQVQRDAKCTNSPPKHWKLHIIDYLQEKIMCACHSPSLHTNSMLACIFIHL